MKVIKSNQINKFEQLKLKSPAPVQQLVSLTYKGMCSGMQIYPPVGTLVYYRPVGGSWKIFHYVYYNNRFDKKITTNKLKVGNTYEFWVYAGGGPQQRTVTVQKAENFIDVKLPDALCKSLIRGR